MYNWYMDELISRLAAVVAGGSGGQLYLSLTDEIVRSVNDGLLPAGSRIPPSRQLAGQIGVHRNTINKVYEELNARGVVKSRVGSGTYVLPTAGEEETEQQSSTAFPWSSLVSNVATAEPLMRLHRLSSYVSGSDYINLSRMAPSEDLIPVDLIRKSTDHVIRTHGPAVFGYGPAQGLTSLRSLIADELDNSGIPTAGEEVIITTGSQQALDLTARLLCNPGDTILMEQHSYTGAINAFTSIGATIRSVACDEDGPVISALNNIGPGEVKALYLMPSCSNPTGRTIPRERRLRLVEWSLKRNVPIIEDDYGADLDDEAMPPAMRSLNGDIIYLGTFSKKLAPALRVGFILAPQELVTRLNALKQAMDLGTSLLQQYVLSDFIGKGYLRAHLRKIQPIYQSRRKALTASLLSNLPDGAELRIPEAGILLWLNLPGGLNSEDLFREALRHGVLVSPGSYHAVSPVASSGVRLTFCAENEERLRLGGERLCQAIKALKKQNETRKSNSTVPSLDGV